MSDDTLFREVDEEVRQDQYKKFWKRYGNYFIAICILVVLGVAGYKAYEYYQKKDAEADSILYFDGVRDALAGKPEDGLKNFELVTKGGYQQLAKLQAANLLTSQGKGDEAIKAYQTIAEDQDIDVIFRDVARIRAGYLQVDSVPPETLKASFEAYDKDGVIWRPQVREIIALSAYRTGDYTQAKSYLQANVDDLTTPPGMKQRNQVLLQLITPKLQK